MKITNLREVKRINPHKSRRPARTSLPESRRGYVEENPSISGDDIPVIIPITKRRH